NARKGKPARMVAKLNSLVDQPTIDHLYEASIAGVNIDLILRGTCCLVPGLRGLSENIRVRSIAGRLLEHSRVYFFQNHGGEPIYMAGSADWMPRNFHRRIEVVFPIDDPRLQKEIFSILEILLKDTAEAKELKPTGAYVPVPCPKDTPPFSAQNYFLEEAAA